MKIDSIWQEFVVYDCRKSHEHTDNFIPQLLLKTNQGPTTMQTAKQEALDAIQRLPDDVEIEDMIYRLYVLENVRRGQQDAIDGKSETAENVLKEIQSW